MAEELSDRFSGGIRDAHIIKVRTTSPRSRMALRDAGLSRR
jgi:hypothetical protein